MSKHAVLKFVTAVLKSEDLQAQVFPMETHDLIRFAKEMGYEFTSAEMNASAEEVTAFAEKLQETAKRKGRELSEEELEAVAGGLSFEDEVFYSK